MRSTRGLWALAGLVAGAVGLATSYAVASLMAVRSSPVVAVAELIIQITPGEVVEQSISVLGFHDKTVLIGGIFVVLGLLFAWAGLLAARSWWAPILVFGVLAGVGVAATAIQHAPSLISYLPLGLGFLAWVIVLNVLAERLRSPQREVSESRRGFLLGAGVAAAAAVGMGVLGRFWGAGRRRVEEARALLRLSDVTEPKVPGRARIHLPGVTPWQTSEDDFYLIHTAIALPTIEPDKWQLRIHGMVDRELTLTYPELVARPRTEAWITLNCVSNPVGGDLIGNAWWSGVRLADLLAYVGVSPEADALLQTSEDGWTCSTPLAACTDDRDAMLAIAMNGRPLPIEHGFPVRTIVPGLYGFVSACKWVVDIEVTRFDRIEAYWTGKGWAEQAPVKLASRIDVPREGADVPAGGVRVGGVAWHQQVGIRGVEVAVDGGDWQPAEIASPPTDDTWVQWAGTVEVEPGDHTVRVRAIDKDGEVQTGVERDVVPDGATGWHEVHFTAREV